jgi:hypothetical protein
VLGDLHRQAVDPDRAGRSGADDAADLGGQEERRCGERDILVRHGALCTDLGRDGGNSASEPLDDLRHDCFFFSE